MDRAIRQEEKIRAVIFFIDDFRFLLSFFVFGMLVPVLFRVYSSKFGIGSGYGFETIWHQITALASDFLANRPPRNVWCRGDDQGSPGAGRLKWQYDIAVWFAVTVNPCLLKRARSEERRVGKEGRYR